MKNIIKQNIRLYPTRFYMDVIVGNNEFLRKVIKDEKYYDDEDFNAEEIEEYNSDGTVWSLVTNVDGKDALKFLLYFKDKNDFTTLSHEAIHITWEIHRNTGIEMNVNAQEFQCYMHDYILERVFEIIAL